MLPYSGLLGYTYGLLAPYGTLSLTVTSPPQSFTEPITLDEVKAYLNLPVRSPVDQGEDDTLSGFITAAREQAEILQGRDLVRKQWDLALDYFLTYAIVLRAPLVSVDLIQYKDMNGTVTALTEGIDYVVDTSKQPGITTPKFNTTWPAYSAWPTSSALVRFTSGYQSTDAFWNDSGARIKIGMKMLISMWFNNRLPFEAGPSSIAEYPYAVTSCLSYGAIERAH